MSETLQAQLKGGESARTEFSRDAKTPERIAEHVCAFLNSDTGGTIICGADSRGSVVGIANAGGAAIDLQLALVKLVTPPALISTSVEPVDGKELVVVEVPSGPDRPYVVGGGVWLRKGSRTAPADANSLRAMFVSQAEQPERWERRLSASMIPEDLKQGEVLELRDEARRAGRFDFTGDETAETVLDRLAMTRPGGYTQAADVLFSSNPALRHPQVRVQFSVFPSDEVGDEFDDLRTFEGPLLRVADDVAETLVRSNAIRSSFRPDDMERRDAPRYARYALREGVVNALVHRDYASYSGGVKVSVYPNRIEIWNTGRLPDGLKPDDLARPHPSILINPDIAHAFFLRNRMDKLGRGGQRLAEECKLIGAQAPEWVQIHGGVRLTLFAALGKEKARQELFNDRQRAFIEEVAPGQRVSLSDYQARFASMITDRQARRDLKELETYRFVRREGVGRKTVYRRLDD